MMDEKLIELAARVEAATGLNLELDDAIAEAIFTGKHRCCIKGLTDEAGGMWMFTYPDGSVGSSLRFTASLDAATSLFPPDTMYRSGHDGSGPDPSLFFCEAIGPAPECRRTRSVAYTEPGARTAAALRTLSA